jgi:predicted dehydrogenase
MIRRYASGVVRRVRRYTSAAIRPLREYRRERRLLDAVQVKKPAYSSGTRSTIRYKVAIIGAGGMGQDQCLGIKTLRQVDIVAVADKNPKAIDRLRRQADLPDIHVYDSAEALLNQEKVDLVCVATNTTTHLSVARLAIEAGVKRLVVEKPIGNSVAQAREFAVLCADKKVKLAVNHSRRWSNDYAAIKRCIEHGYIGALRQVYIVPGPGGLAMIGVHFFDLMAYLAHSSFAWVIGFLDTCDRPNRRGPQFKDPGGYALVGLENGVRGYLDISDDLNRKDLFMVLRGDAGRIEIDELRGEWCLDNPSLGRRTFQFQDTTDVAGYFAKVAGEMLFGATPSCGAAEGIAALEAVVATHLSNSHDHLRISLPLEGKDAEPEFAFP